VRAGALGRVLGLVALLVVACAAAFLVGGVHLSIADLVAGRGEEGQTARLLASLRAPRIALAALVGGCLALAGAALQALLKNPLADPFLLGTSGGAAVGAAGAALLGLSPLLSPAAAFVGAAAASLGVALLARRGGRLDLQRLLLAGLIANAFFSALLLAAFSIASGEAARSMLFWMMGSLADATPRKVASLLPYALAGAAVLVAAAARLNLFSVGEENAAALGVDVAFAGVIGFVGLLVPHAVRAAFGNDQRTLLPASFLVGATLVVAADAVARAAIAPAELPIGALTAALGAPVFAWLLLRTP
jgi:ABC-type Fe3+-siderophore transport system permease subunit